MDINVLKLQIAGAQALPLIHGAHNLSIPEQFFDNIVAPDLAFDRVRVINHTRIAFDHCGLPGFRAADTDLDAFEFKNCLLQGAQFKRANLYYFEIVDCDVNGLTMEDCCFCVHLWDEGARGDMIEPYRALPDTLPHLRQRGSAVISPYVDGFEGLMGLTKCHGSDVKIIRPLGGYRRPEISYCRFERFSMTGPGLFQGIDFLSNRLKDSEIRDMIFEGGYFTYNRLVNTPVTRCRFKGVDFTGSMIEITPEILSSAFINCKIAHDLEGMNLGLLLVHQGKVVVGAAPGENGFLVPDKDLEEFTRALMKDGTPLHEEAIRKFLGLDLFDKLPASASMPVIGFSEIYPELLKQAVAKNLIPAHHPDAAAVRPGCAKVWKALQAPLFR